MVRVRNDYSRFREAGSDVAVITMGSVQQTAALRDRLQLPFVCLADPQRHAYAAFGIPQGSLLQISGPAVWGPGLKSVLRAGVGVPTGDVRQLHGTFIVDTRGLIRYIHLPRNSADLPDDNELLARIEALS